ncbi:NTF2 fold immunity protein of polymorphic toxin system component [Maribacter spongiicola]|uniref:NTF2 fold immunity protein of polymorphic toxin system component n=1 Tax=Maribacter spongiicola TaxID=1206753 RepID=A0A4R7KCV9_9FLAO|nr:NTF2 fold immunity protein [Maribacter spongiicola]TDT50526.1 NTF2 fold immunity protein of polymorphic toxin system component [Maribacter spongiicola]
MKKPTDLTKEFISDYKEWNDFAFKSKENKTEDFKFKIGKMYDDLILKYCSPNKKYQGLAYGSSSNHCPNQEVILDELIDNNTAIVKTKFTNEKFSFLQHNYEYHFILENGKWILEELYLVDDDGKYKSL